MYQVKFRFTCGLIQALSRELLLLSHKLNYQIRTAANLYIHKNMSRSHLPTMQALKRDSANKTVRLVTMPKPGHPRSGHVLVKVVYGGICGTDLSIMDGHLDLRDDMILGHEISGTLVEVGIDVWTLRPGQNVIIAPQIACGQCHYCQQGNPLYCQKGALESAIGWSQDGGWREFWELPACQVLVLAEDVPLVSGILCEPFCCVFQGWERNGPQPQDAKILIMGAGVIGLLWGSLFHMRGYEGVTITDPNEHRRALADGLELGYRVCEPKQLARELAHADTELQGYQLIIDCSGNVVAIQQAISWLKRGGTLNLFGIPPSTAEVVIKPSQIMVRSITIVGTLINPQSLPRALPTFTTLVRKGYLDFAKLGIQVFPFTDYELAIATLRNSKVTKAVLDIGSYQSSN